MSQIGTLTPRDKGGYRFVLRTLTQSLKGDLVPNPEKKGNAPDYRAFLDDQTEVGAAWNKTGEHGAYVSITLDDPFVPEALYVNSFKRDDGKVVLLWTRKSR